MSRFDRLSQWGILIAIFLVISFNHILFALSDARPCIDHDLEYAQYSTNVYYGLQKGGHVDDFSIQPDYSPSFLRPSIVEKIIGYFFWVAGHGFFQFRLVFLFFLLLFLFVGFLFVKELFNTHAALLFVLFIVSVPEIISLSRTCWPHLYIAICVLFAFLCLVKSDGFSDFYWTSLFGIVLGSSFFIHYSALIYISIMFAWSFWNLKRDFWWSTLYVTGSVASILFLDSHRVAIAILLVSSLLMCSLKKRAVFNLISAYLLMLMMFPSGFFMHWINVFTVNKMPVWDLSVLQRSYVALKLSFFNDLTFFLFLGGIAGSLYWVLIQTENKKKSLFFQYRMLAVWLCIPSTLGIFLDKGTPTHIVAYCMVILFMIASFFDLPYLWLKRGLIGVLLGLAICVNVLYPFFEFPQRCLKPDKNLWGRKEMKLFLDEAFQAPFLHIGILASDYTPLFFKDSPFYVYGKLSLQLLSKEPVAVLHLSDKKMLKKHLYDLNYVIFYSTDEVSLQPIKAFLEDETVFHLVQRIRTMKNDILIYGRKEV